MAAPSSAFAVGCPRGKREMAARCVGTPAAVSWLLLSSETSTPGPDSFKSHAVGNVEAGLRLVASHLRGRSCRAHKSRVDLDALAALTTGEQIRSVELIPDELHARWRDTHEVIAIELLPQRVGLGSSVGADAVVLLVDAHGAAKGLPHNELASRVAAACGLKLLTCRGDAFLCRLREDDGALLLGGDATPEMMGGQDWLAKAQKCASLAHGAGVCSPLQEALTAQLAAAAATAAATATATAAAAAAASLVAAGEAAPALGVLGWENGGDAESEDAHVLVRVAVPPETRAKHVKCDVKPEWLRLEVSTLHAAPLLVDGQLFYPVKPAECSWALEDAKGGDGRWLTLSLEKAHQNMRWLDLTRKPGVSYHKTGDCDVDSSG